MKYKLPSNHELFSSKTKLELLTEYHLDNFDKNPLEVHRQADGEIQFKDTGDELIDKWEEQIASGEDVDMLEAFTEEGMDKLAQLLKKAKGQRIAGAYAASESMKDVVERVERENREARANLPDDFGTFGQGY